jgi:hypothetical protein
MESGQHAEYDGAVPAEYQHIITAAKERFESISKLLNVGHHLLDVLGVWTFAIGSQYLDGEVLGVMDRSRRSEHVDRPAAPKADGACS